MREFWLKAAVILRIAGLWLEERAVRIKGWRLFDNDYGRSYDNANPEVHIDLAYIPKSSALREYVVRGATRKRTMPDIKDGPWSGLNYNSGNADTELDVRNDIIGGDVIK